MKNVGFYILFIVLLIILAFLVNYIIEETTVETFDENLFELSFFCDVESNNGGFPISILSCDNNSNFYYMINYGNELPNPVYTKDKELMDHCNSVSTTEFCKGLVCSKSPAKTLMCN